MIVSNTGVSYSGEEWGVGIRDALFEPPCPQDYAPQFAELNKCCGRADGVPAVYAVQGEYGSGKTRLLLGLLAEARGNEDTGLGHPTTFLNTSDYEPDTVLNALLCAMAKTYSDSRRGKNKKLRAEFFGALAGSIDLSLKFCSSASSLLGAVGEVAKAIDNQGGLVGIAKTIKRVFRDATEEERKSLGIPFADYGDLMSAIKAEFASMVADCCGMNDGANAHTGPWYVALDDLDRLPPAKAFDVLLGLRSIVGGAFNLQGELSPPPPVVFLLAVNLNSMIPALRDRFNLPTQKDPAAPEESILQEYVRKLYLPGLGLPPVSKESIEKGMNGATLPDDFPLEKIARLAAGFGLSHRLVFQTIDGLLWKYGQKIQELAEPKRSVFALCWFIVLVTVRLASQDERKRLAEQFNKRALSTGKTGVVIMRGIITTEGRAAQWLDFLIAFAQNQPDTRVSEGGWNEALKTGWEYNRATQ